MCSVGSVYQTYSASRRDATIGIRLFADNHKMNCRENTRYLRGNFVYCCICGLLFLVEVENGQIRPIGWGDVAIATGGVVLHYASVEGGVDKGDELLYGFGQHGGNLVAYALEAENPVAVALAVELAL